MPVKASDTMLSSHFDSIAWNDSAMQSLDDDLFTMNLLGPEFNESLSLSFDSEPYENMDFSDLVNVPSSPKYQIRHHDCMWSGTCVDKSHPSKKKGINLCAASAANHDQQQQQVDSTSNAQKTTENVKVILNKSIMTPKNIMSTMIVCKNSNSKISSQNRSLLVNNSLVRVNTNTAALTYSIKQENTSKDQCKSNDLDSLMNTSIANLRPDTPLSLGDDVPELKHNIDLTPCPSSNRMKFSDPNSLKIINALAEELEETSNSLNESTPFGGNFRNLQRSSPSDLQEILQDITFLSDYEDACDDSSIIDIDDEDQLDESDYKAEENAVQKMFTANIKSQAMTSRAASHHHEFISDHSYTRPKGSRYDMISLGVQTPSDSEDDIDVVGINAKNLPTNPSARDRRALQTHVAHKIARSKQQANSRRRTSDDDSISSSTSTLSSKGSTPIKYGSQTPARYVSSSSASSHSISSRKRQAPAHFKDSNNSDHSNKRYKTSHKKQKLNHRHHPKTITLDQEELETIEKRNLHNNMERQRRIGLKNLFEELKCHIPSLREKERAPKVNILREAAVYCTKLRREEEQYAELMKKNNRLQTRLRNLKASIGQQRRHY